LGTDERITWRKRYHPILHNISLTYVYTYSKQIFDQRNRAEDARETAGCILFASLIPLYYVPHSPNETMRYTSDQIKMVTYSSQVVRQTVMEKCATHTRSQRLDPKNPLSNP